MKTRKVKYCNEKGVVVPLVAIMLSVLLGAVALAIDVGYMMNTRTELQRIADAAALAGARTLGRLYECNADLAACTQPMPYEDQLTFEPDPAIIKQASMDVASQNQAGGSKTGITIIENEIIIGNWDGATHILTANSISPDAVRVTVRRDSSANGPINLFFARVLGIDTADVSATATAALTGESTAGPGGLPIPVAINKSWVTDPSHCEEDLTFHPSSAGTCSAWHSYLGDEYKPTGSPVNGMPALLNDTASLAYSSPETIAGETQYEFTNGTLATVFEHEPGYIQNLFDVMKMKNDGKLDMDEDGTTWTTSIPVFDDTVEGCSPNGSITIVGFATIVITKVLPPPVTTIYATLKCDNVRWGRGGGAPTGTKGSIPGLVQ